MDKSWTHFYKCKADTPHTPLSALVVCWALEADVEVSGPPWIYCFITPQIRQEIASMVFWLCSRLWAVVSQVNTPTSSAVTGLARGLMAGKPSSSIVDTSALQKCLSMHVYFNTYLLETSQLYDVARFVWRQQVILSDKLLQKPGICTNNMCCTQKLLGVHTTYKCLHDVLTYRHQCLGRQMCQPITLMW